MTIASEITRINNNIQAAYSACSDKGATMPANQNSANLADCISSITAGTGGGSVTLYAWESENVGSGEYLYTTTLSPTGARDKIYAYINGQLIADDVVEYLPRPDRVEVWGEHYSGIRSPNDDGSRDIIIR